MNRLQKTAALYKAAKLKKAAAAMLLVKHGYMQKRADEGTDGEPEKWAARKWLDQALDVFKNFNKYTPVLDQNENELFVDDADRAFIQSLDNNQAFMPQYEQLNKIRYRQLAGIGNIYKQLPDHDPNCLKLFDERYYNPPLDSRGFMTLENRKALELDYVTPPGASKTWYGRPRSPEEKQALLDERNGIINNKNNNNTNNSRVISSSSTNGTPWYMHPRFLGKGALTGLGLIGLIYLLSRRKKKKSSEKTAK